MGYILGQYNKKVGIDDNIFMTYITEGQHKRKIVSSDEGVSGLGGIFKDECCYVPSNLITAKHYYFFCKIKRMLTPQTFYIKLVNYDDPAGEGLEQYIKTINVAAGDVHEWVDVEFTFTPLATFDTVIFELQRTVSDYREQTRYPIIAYEELSSIDNLISARIQSGVSLIKMGMQSRPGLLMCINGEEIRVPRTGIYELKNGIMLINLLSVLAPSKENTDVIKDWMIERNIEVDEATTEEELEAIESECFFGTSKTRTIDSFTLDYMYKEEA